MKRRIAMTVTLVTVLAALPAAPGAAQTPTPRSGNGAASTMPRDNRAEPGGTGRIRGRVVDAESGSAMRDAIVQLSGGGLREARTVGTDEGGVYEFEDLPAGRFNLSVSKPSYMTVAYGQRRPFESGKPIELADKQTLDTIDVALPRAGVIAAHVTDALGEPVSGVRVVAQRLRFANGEQRLVAVSSSAGAGPSPLTDDQGYARMYGLPPGDYYVSVTRGLSETPIFYPGTSSVDAAQTVTVKIGAEVSVSFPLVSTPSVRVSGAVLRADGSPGGGRPIFFEPAGGGARMVSAKSDGTFTIADVPSGEFVVRSFWGSPQPTLREEGRAVVPVNGADVSGVVIGMTRGGSIRGRIVFDTARPTTGSFPSIRPYVTSASNGRGVTREDGTFVFDGIWEPGVIRLRDPPAGWFLKAVRLGDKDITDVPVTIEPDHELVDIQVVVTTTLSELNGSVSDDAGTTIGDYAVVVFPEDRAQWTPASRFIFAARPDQQGRFKITGLPAGKYLAAAVDYVESGTEHDPRFLSQLRDRATPINLAERETKTVTLVLDH